MKKILKWAGIIFLGLIVIGIFAGKDKSAGNDSVAVSEDSKFKLNDIEKTILSEILQDELSTFAEGGDSLLGNGLITVSGKEVAKDYEDNQVGADSKYYKKSLLLKGKVESINSGLGNEPYIALSGVNPFMNPQVHFDNANVEKISTISKGQILNFVCIGNGSIVGTPMFKDCVFAEDYGVKKVSDINNDINRFLNGSNSKIELTPLLVSIAVYSSKQLTENSVCYTDKSKCMEEIKKILGKVSKEDLKKVENEIREKVK